MTVSCSSDNRYLTGKTFITLLVLDFLLISLTRGLAGEKEQDPAPLIYDDFSDGKVAQRTGKDPWERKLPTWNILSGRPDASKGFVRPSGISSWVRISIPCDFAYGTWQWRYRFPKGGVKLHRQGATIRCDFIVAQGESGDARNFTGYSWCALTDGHFRFWKSVEHKALFLLHVQTGTEGINIPADNRWHTIRITRSRAKGISPCFDGQPVSDGYGGLYVNVRDEAIRKHLRDFRGPRHGVTDKREATVIARAPITINTMFIVTLMPGAGRSVCFDDFKAYPNTVVEPPQNELFNRVSGKVNVYLDERRIVRGNFFPAGWLSARYSGFLEMLSRRGCVFRSSASFPLTNGLLENVDVYLAVSGPNSFSNEEVKALEQFIERGGKALLMGGGDSPTGCNVFLVKYGMSFNTPHGSPVAKPIPGAESLLLKGIKQIKGLGASRITVSAPARTLMAAGENVQLAVFESEPGVARIVCIGDEWPLQDGKNGLASETMSHMKLAENIVAWFVEDPRDTAGVQAHARQQPPY